MDWCQTKQTMQRCHNPWLQHCNILWSVPTNTRPEKLTASHGYIPLPLVMVRPSFVTPLKQRGGVGLRRHRGRWYHRIIILGITQTLGWQMLCSGMPRVPQLSPLLVRLGSGRMEWQMMSGEYDHWVLMQRTERERDGLNRQRGRQTLEHLEKWYVSFADVYSNSSLQFDIPSTKHWFSVFFFLFLASLWPP